MPPRSVQKVRDFKKKISSLNKSVSSRSSWTWNELILQENLPTPDLKIICENNVPIFCHQSFLAGSSTFLRRIFQSISVKNGDDGFRLSEDVTLYCPDIDSNAISKCLQLLYDGGTLISTVNKDVIKDLKYVFNKVLLIDVVQLNDRGSITALPIEGERKMSSRDFYQRKESVTVVESEKILESEEVAGKEIASNETLRKSCDQGPVLPSTSLSLEETTTPPQTNSSEPTFFSPRETCTKLSTSTSTIDNPKSTPSESESTIIEAFRPPPTPPRSLLKKRKFNAVEERKEQQYRETISSITTSETVNNRSQSSPQPQIICAKNKVEEPPLPIPPATEGKKRKLNPFEEHLLKEIAKSKAKAAKATSTEIITEVPGNKDVAKNINRNDIVNSDKVVEGSGTPNSNSNKPLAEALRSSIVSSTPSNKLRSPIGEIFAQALKAVPKENKKIESPVVDKTNVPFAPAYSVETIHTCYICRGMKDGKRDPDAEISFSAIKKLKEHYGKHFYSEGLIFEYFEVGESNKNPDGSIKDQFGKVKKYKCEEKGCWKVKKPPCGYKEMALHMSSEHGIFEKIIAKDSRPVLHKLLDEIKENTS